MDTGRQFLRYSVPGSLFVLTAFGTQVGLHHAWGARSVVSNFAGNSASVVALLGASIPLGLIVYQTYYASYRAVRAGGRIPTADRGAEVLRHLTCAQRRRISVAVNWRLDARVATQRRGATADASWLDRRFTSYPLRWLNVLRLTDWETEPCPAGRPNCPCLGRDLPLSSVEDEPVDSHPTERAYAARWRNNWNALMVVVDLAAGYQTTAPIKREYLSKSDIYHALGASRTAVWTATVGMLVVDTVTHRQLVADQPRATAVAVLLVLTVSTAVGLILHQTRRQTQLSMLSQLSGGLRAALTESTLCQLFGEPEAIVDLRSPEEKQVGAGGREDPKPDSSELDAGERSG